jgi:ribosomal protein L15E
MVIIKEKNLKKKNVFFTGYHYLVVWYEVIYLDIHHTQIYGKRNQNIINFINVT